ncbi:MAG: hypothetical protein ACYSWO_03540 [Planctomycetota bacterium]|jgi:hypothetical protein
MKLITSYPVRVVATGFVVLTLLSIPLFWVRFFCRATLSEMMPDNVRNISIEPSGFISPDIDEDPNLTQNSQVSARIDQDYFMCLGIFDCLISRYPMGRRSDVFVAKSEDNWAYFDRASGLIICRYTQTETMPDRNRLHRQVQYYIGPEGISEIQDEELGRFVEPIIDFNWRIWTSRQPGLRDLILYDKIPRQFFRIDFDRATVTRGPQVSDRDYHQPVQIGWLDKNTFMLHLNWQVPKKALTFTVTSIPPGRGVSRKIRDVMLSAQHYPASPHLLVLDKCGRIDLLDKKTLEFVATAGRLPKTKSVFGTEQVATPQSSLSYGARPLYLGQPLWPSDPEANDQPTPDPNSLQYAGMFAASLSRDGTGIALTVFDKEGKVNQLSYHKGTHYGGRYFTARNSGDDVYFGTAWAPACSIGKYVAESLHPPVLSIASCFTASAFEAGAGHRALFLPPNSFVAMNARDNRGGIWVKIVIGLLLLTPSILLAAWLACRVTSDAATVGLPRNLRHLWTLLTLAFGLAGYITYRLMRPTITLVTCPNCGKGRRPDMETCHQCNSKWQVPELVPPTWRVLQS